MKKFLALVLALVMTMSLVTIAGAEDFTDAADVTYTEAVDVMTAVGVVGGYADGSFNPDAGLTRGAAAKIICNMILGPTTAEALNADAAPYSDVPADSTFAGYIAFCQKEDIISGYADGTFRPAAPLTGYAFMKMLLGALGYDKAIEGYEGGNWSINVAKQALAIGLDDGLVGNFVGTKALTREEACLYAFNAMLTKMVAYPNNTSIVVGDITVTTSADAQVQNYTFADKYFDDLTGVPAHDACGRPATTWYTSSKLTKASKVGTYADVADYVIVTEKAFAAKTYDELTAILIDLADNEDLFFVAGKTDLYVNGSKAANALALNAVDEAGTVYELFCEDDANGNYVTDVAVLDYEIAEIEKLDTKLTKAQKEDGATVEVELKDAADFLDIEFAGYDADTYVKGAYVLYVTNAKGDEVIASEIAEVVEGTVTQYKKASAEVSIDGVWYDNVTGAAIKHGTEGSFYLNKAGQVCAVDATEVVSDNYAYIYALDVDTKGVNADGYEAGSVTAYFVKADGTKASAVVDATYDKANNQFIYNYDDKTVVATGLIAYTIEDGALCLADPADEVNATGVKAEIDKDSVSLGGQYVTVDTQFIFMDNKTDASKMKVSTAVGYKAVSSADTVTKYYVYDKDTDAVLFAFADAKNAKVDTDLYAVLLDATPVYDVDADDVAVNIYSVAIDGVETTLTVKVSDDVLAGMDYGYVFTYEVTDGYVSSAKTVKAADVVAVYDDYLVAKDGTILYYNDEAIWTVTREYDVKGVIESVTVDEGGSYDKDWNIYYTVEDSTTKLTNAWIIENIK